MVSGPTLPTELLHDIAFMLYEERRGNEAQCKNADLMAFSRASRYFYKVAVPLIFREVCLQDVERAVCCLQTLLTNDLAAVSVKRFAILGVTIQPSFIVTQAPAVVGQDVSRVLERLPNLLTLRLEPSMPAMRALFQEHGTEWWKEVSEEIFVPKGATTYPFQLSTFVTSLPSDETINSFLIQQKEIRNMSYRGQLSGVEWKPSLLPALRQLTFSVHEQPPSAVQGLLDGRRLEHLLIDTFPHGDQKADPESPYIMELRPTLIPLLEQLEGLESITLRSGLSDLLKLLTSRTGRAEPPSTPKKPLHVSCLLDPSIEYTRNVDYYVVITMTIIALAGLQIAPLKALTFNILPSKQFGDIHSMVSNVSSGFMTEGQNFSTYFYDQKTRTAKQLYVKSFTPTLEWAYENVPYETVPEISGSVFNLNTDEKWQRYPETECNLSLQ